MDIHSREFKKYYTGLPEINKICEDCHMTYQDLADKCHVSLRQLFRWKSGGGLMLTFQARVVLREIYDLYRVR